MICLRTAKTLIALIAVATTLANSIRAQDEAAQPAALITVASSEVSFDAPAVVTTVGRADGTIVRVLCQRAGVDVTLVEDLTSGDLEGVGTLVVAMGGSTKGLGAAGLDADTELERGREALALAGTAEVPILGVHVGGAARRGELSDPFCELVAAHSAALVVKAGGNEDGFFTRAARAHDIPLIEVETNGAAIEAITRLFE